MKIKLDLGDITLDEAITYGFYALFGLAFIEPIAMGLYVFGLCMLPLLAAWAAWELWERHKRAIERADYEARMRGEMAPDRGEVNYPEC